MIIIAVCTEAWIKSRWICCVHLIAICGLKAIELKLTLDQPSGNCNKLNSYLYICGWFFYIWGWLRASFSQLWPISFISLSVPCLYKCGQSLYISRWSMQLWLNLIHLMEVLYIWRNFYISGSNKCVPSAKVLYIYHQISSMVIKVRSLRLELELHINSLQSIISKDFTGIPVKWLELLLFLNVNSQNAVK